MEQLTQRPDYTQTSDKQLRRLEKVQMNGLLRTDFRRFLIKSSLVIHQMWDFLHGDPITIDWDPDVTGIKPDLDEKKRQHLEQLDAIWEEKHLRRSVREQLRSL